MGFVGMRIFSNRIIVASLVCAVSAHLKAEGDIEQVDVEGVNVFERQSVTEADREAYSGFIKYIDRGSFEDRFTLMSDLLDNLPSVQVSESGGVGSFSNTFVRGLGGKQISYYLDGMLLNQPNSGMANTNIPTAVIERLEVYPDFPPAQLGNANLGGSVVFHSRRIPKNENGGQFQLSQDTFDNFHTEFAGWGHVGDWEMLAALSYTDAENNYPVSDDLFETDSDERLNDGYKNTGALLKAAREYEIAKTNHMLQFSESKKEIPTRENQLNDNASIKEENWRWQSVVDYGVGEWDLGNRFYFTSHKSLFKDDTGSIGLNRSQTETETEISSVGIFSLAQKQWLTKHNLVGSLDITYYDVNQFNHLDNVSETQGERNSVVFALSDQWQVNKAYNVNLNWRHYVVEDSVELFRQDLESDSSISASTFHLGNKLKLGENVSLMANIANQIRVPTVAEKYGNQGLYVSEPELKHEKARVADLGIAYQSKTLSTSTSVFYKKVDDGIFIVYSSGVANPRNSISSQILGIEANLQWQLMSWLSFQMNATLLDSENLSDLPDRKGKSMPGIFHQEFGFAIEVVKGNHIVSLGYQFKDELYFNPQAAGQADQVTDVSMSWAYTLSDITIDVSAKNLLDKHFYNFYQLPTPGRSISLSVTYRF